MNVQQIYPIVNAALKETLGETAVLNEDLSNIVQMGEAVFNAQSAHIYSKNLVNRIGKTVFEAEKYEGRAPSVYMDGWEYGSVKQKITFELNDATENESWELQNGQSYDPNIFTEANVNVKYFNGKTTFEVPISITEEMIKQSFVNVEQLNSLVSGIFTYIENTLTIATDNLVMRTINNFIAETVHDAGTTRVRHLLTEYNTLYNKSIADIKEALSDPEFCRYMALQMDIAESRLGVMSKVFNIGAKPRFTPKSRLHFVMLDVVKAAYDIYLQSGTYHDDYTKLPNAETIPYWQGSGTSYDLNDISKIDVKTSAGNTVSQGAIAGVMFDRNALGVSCMNKRTTTNYNGKAEFTNYWFKQDAMYFNDTDENGIVFLID